MAAELPAEPPAWVHLLPAGTATGRDGRGPYRLNEPRKVIARTHDYAGSMDLPIDYDHQSDFGAVPGIGGTAPAAGWIKDLQVRPNGIWGRAEWTPRATAHIRAREYRHLSPVFDYAPKTGEIMRLRRAGLTNNPNFELTALAGAGESMDETMKRIRALLGLPEAAPDNQVITALEKVAGGGATAANAALLDPTRYVPVELYRETASALAELRAGTTESDATRAADAAIAAGKLTPAMRDWAVATCRENPAGFAEFVDKMPAVFAHLSKISHATAAPPPRGAQSGAGLTAEQLAICRNLGIAPDAYAKNLER
jgi:phage I-like protein